MMARFAYASCTPFSNKVALSQTHEERSGLLFRASAQEVPPDALLTQIVSLLNLGNPLVVLYADKKRCQRRTALLHHSDTQTTLEGFMLAGDISAQSWIIPLLQNALPAQDYGRALLLPGAKLPVPVVSLGQQVCALFNVTDVSIEAHLNKHHGSPDERMNSHQLVLKCGTNFDSCVPRLPRMLRQQTAMRSSQ